MSLIVSITSSSEAPVPPAVSGEAKGEAVVLRRGTDGTYFERLNTARVDEGHGLIGPQRRVMR